MVQKIRPDTDVGDLWNIFNLIRRLKPNVVVEYGSGASTFIILQALNMNDKGVLYSIERNPEYGSKVIEKIPMNLQARLVSSREYGPTVDLFYIDDEHKDILPSLESADPGAIVLIDGRVEQTKRLIEGLRSKREISVSKSFMYGNTTINLD